MKTAALYSSLIRFWRMLKPDRSEVWQLYFYSMFNGLIALTLPIGIQAIFNYIQAGRVSVSWVVLIVFVLGGVLLSGFLQIVQLYMSERLQQKIFTRAALEFAYRIPRIRLSAIEQKHAPELVNRFFEVTSIQKGITKTLIEFPASLLQIFFSLVLLAFFHPVFIPVGFSVLFLILIILRVHAPVGLDTSLKESSAKFEMVHWLEETARTMQTFKMAGNTNLPMRKTDAILLKYLESRQNHFKILIRQFSSLVGFKTLIAGTLLIAGGLLVFKNQIGLGQFLAAEIVILMIMTSVEKLILSTETIYDVLTGLEKIGSFTDLELEDHENGLILPVTGNGMEVKAMGLSFTYIAGEKPVLKALSFAVESGQKICIAGSTGSGKNTLLKVLAGHYESFDGTLIYNGLPIHSLNLSSLRDQTGDLFSPGLVFSGSIEENLAMGKPGISIHEIMASARISGFHNIVESLPLGYATKIGPGGHRLSQSETMLLRFTRCLIHKPTLILVRESFDVLGEEVRKNLFQLLMGPENKATAIIVSNDVKVAAMSDCVWLLQDGQLLASGRYEEIMNLPVSKEIFHA